MAQSKSQSHKQKVSSSDAEVTLQCDVHGVSSAFTAKQLAKKHIEKTYDVHDEHGKIGYIDIVAEEHQAQTKHHAGWFKVMATFTIDEGTSTWYT